MAKIRPPDPNQVIETIIQAVLSRHRFENISRELLEQIADETAKALHHSVVVGRWDVTATAGLDNSINVRVTPRSAVDQLADLADEDQSSPP